MMLTLISCPKSFDDPLTALHQDNAIGSWAALNGETEIILFGNESGVNEATKRFNAVHVPDVLTTDSGTPLFSDILQRAQREASNERVAYINADIILTSDVIKANSVVWEWNKEAALTGARTDVSVENRIDFSNPYWEDDVESLARSGKAMSAGIDYLIFNRGAFSSIPPFAIGRTTFDNWLVWSLRHRRIPLVDAGRDLIAVHQMHESVPWEIVRSTPEARRNQSLVGTWKRSFTLGDATHRLANGLIESRRAGAWLHRGRVEAAAAWGWTRRVLRPIHQRIRRA